MTLTFEIPADLDTARRKSLADALSEAGLITSEEAAALLTQAAAKSPSLRQGSPEWKALLYQNGPAHGVVLPQSATSREAVYGDDSR